VAEERNYRSYLPSDIGDAHLIGRIWVPSSDPNNPAGPVVVTTDNDNVYGLSEFSGFCSELMNRDDLIECLTEAKDSTPICALKELIENSLADDRARVHLLSPIDLQCIKAAGVTFAVSLIERLVEERSDGDMDKAADIRADIENVVGANLSEIKPGSAAAKDLEQHLKSRGMWSQYLEVGIGPYAEIFTKSQPLSSVGFGAEIGLHPDSTWNNPEPEVVLIVDAAQHIVGVTLGNDVNLRDFEGRSSLLLCRAKDNNASCALGPFIRLLDNKFTLDDVRKLQVELNISGEDGFELDAQSQLTQISRDISDLVAQCSGPTHQYPDGFVLMTGTLFAPIKDRSEPGKGFTHNMGDLVEISAPQLGSALNKVTTSDQAPPWSMGISALVRNLQSRDML